MIWADLSYEKKLWREGYQSVVGVDEVGRGSWAGPVVTATVIFPAAFKPTFQLADSKLLSIKRRLELDEAIKNNAVGFAIGEVGLPHINRYGIGRSTQQGFRKALAGLSINPDFLLIDAFYIKYLPKKNQLPIVKGDQKSFSIAAASIIAKVYRDQLMEKLSLDYPNYGFEKHKGYGTKAHQEAIKIHGFSPLHRKSFDLSFLGVES
jgi:ribonuclease HII